MPIFIPLHTPYILCTIQLVLFIASLSVAMQQYSSFRESFTSQTAQQVTCWRSAKSPFCKSLTMEVFVAIISYHPRSPTLRVLQLAAVYSLSVIIPSRVQTLQPCPRRTLGSLDEKNCVPLQFHRLPKCKHRKILS